MILDRPLRSAILTAADSAAIRSLVTKYGMRLGARRFVAGETTEEFLDAARAANQRGFAVAAGILGEGTQTREDAIAATHEYKALLDAFAARKIDANVALKITHLGLDVDADLALQNVQAVAERAAQHGNFMRLDMEQSQFVDRTLDAYRRLRARFENVGCVLQSYLYRSMDDLESLLALQPNIRIVKGAYLETPQIAYPNKADVDATYVRLVERALGGGAYVAVATHDAKIIDHVIAFTNQKQLPQRGRFEFQMLYGVASPLARTLVERGYRVRLAIPYGAYWFPYLMRRLAERPANLAFFLKGAFGRS